MLLNLDHIPFLGSSGVDLSETFRRLGFRCSPDCEYRSQKYPDTIWRSNCVDLQNSWFDLLQDSYTDKANAITLGGCLFRTDNMDGTRNSPLREYISIRYDLTRRFCTSESLDDEVFDITQLDVRHYGIPLSIVGRTQPSVGLASQQLSHPNTAMTLKGIDVQGEGLLAPATLLRNVLDLSMINSLSQSEFVDRYGLTSIRKVVVVTVESLTQAQLVLESTGVHCIKRADLVVATTPWLKCAFAFKE